MTGDNDELQAAIRSVILMKPVLNELLSNYDENRKPLILSNYRYLL